MSALAEHAAYERLCRIDLETLLAQAALLTRVDRKYAVAPSTAELLVDLLPAGAALLEIEGRTSFAYSSTYLDTPELTSFHQGAHQRRRRFKVRSRTYEDSGETYLEVKTRQGAHTVKERLAGSHVDAAGLTTEGADFVAARLAGAGLDPGVTSMLGIILTTRYRRRTVLHADGVTRLTIDSDLRWLDHRVGAAAPLHRPGLTVVETKSGSAASSADRLLWSLGHRPTRLSKYATGLAALDRSLPHNRWHRTLLNHFGS